MPLNQIVVASHGRQNISRVWKEFRNAPSYGILPGVGFVNFLLPELIMLLKNSIYLWVTINAWASMSVPDKTRNHEDAYLVHNIAADQAFNDRFAQLLERDEFRQNVEKLLSLAPVFQVLWMRNNHVDGWDFDRESRLEFVHRVIERNPYNTSNKGENSPLSPRHAR